MKNKLKGKVNITLKKPAPAPKIKNFRNVVSKGSKKA